MPFHSSDDLLPTRSLCHAFTIKMTSPFIKVLHIYYIGLVLPAFSILVPAAFPPST